MSDIPLSLYIHLPWCERKCPYCDFNSHTRTDIPEDAYVDALLADVEWVLPQVAHREIKTLFIGGGTPSLFSGKAITRLLTGIKARLHCADDIEATMEANPGSAEAEKFRAFFDAGINRLSLGVQSFNDKQLKALGRVHSSSQAHRAIEAAMTAGFTRINLDLMHGLPEQSAAEACEDIQTALSWQTEHLSWYQLTIEPNTVYYKQPPLLPVDDTLADIEEAGAQLMQHAGLKRYEVSAWAKPDAHCRHNLNYWQFGDYLALGAGAHGKLTDSHTGKVERYWHSRKPEDYMQRAGTAPAGQRQLSAQDLRFEFLLNALRLTNGFNTSTFTTRTGLDITALSPEIDRAIEQGLLVKHDQEIITTALGRRFLDSITGLFLPTND